MDTTTPMSTITPVRTTTDALERVAGATRPRILVAGLGNSILQDDGIGVHAALALAELELPGVVCAEIGTAVLDGLHLYEWADRIIAIDAMSAGGRPGQIYLTAADDLAGGECEASLHQLDLKAALRLSPEPIAAEIVVIGVEPQTIHYGLDLTPPLQRALPQVVALARRLITAWQAPASADLDWRTVAAAALAGPAA